MDEVAEAAPPARATARAVVVGLGDRVFAVPLEDICEVVRMVAITPVPEAPPWVLGAIDVRGRAAVVVDAGPPLGTAPTRVAVEGYIVLVGSERDPIGIVAEAVEGVTALAEAGPAPESSALVARMRRAGDRLLPVLDVGALCSTVRSELSGGAP